jgi:hypothetical protein
MESNRKESVAMQRKKRWAAVALLAAGMAIGIVMVATPAGAHVGGTVNHLWNHLKPKADKRYVNEKELLWAVVDGDGEAIVRGNGAVSVNRSVAGIYQVRFTRNVRNCVYVASTGLTGASGNPPPGEIAVVGENASVRGVWVQTFDSAGASADRDFHLLVDCGRRSAPARVVPSSGSTSLDNS